MTRSGEQVQRSMSISFPRLILGLFTALISSCAGPSTSMAEDIRERESAALGDRAAEKAVLADYKALGRMDLAERWLAQLRAADPEDADWWHEEAVLLRESGRLVASLECLEALLAMRPEDVDLRYERGGVLAQLRRTDEALLVFQELQVEHPLEWRAYVAEAALRMQRLQGDDLAQAEDRLTRCPEDPAAATLVLFHQALAAELAGRLEEAAHLHEAILEREPEFVPSHRNLALLRMQQGRTEEAIQHLESAQQLIPATDRALQQAMDERLKEWRALRDAVNEDDPSQDP